jgi:hypothetical protein
MKFFNSVFRIVVIALLMGAVSVSAQQTEKDSVINSAGMEMIPISRYPIKKMTKPFWIPNMPAKDTTLPVFNYIVPQQSLFYSYHSEPFQPLALGKDTTKMPYVNYIKAGIGNLSTLMLDAGIGSVIGKNYESYFHIHHLSQQGDLKFQQTVATGLESEGMYHTGNYDWHATANLERNQYYFYGYDHSRYDYTNSDSLLQNYFLFSVGADFKRNEIEDQQLDFRPAVSSYLYSSRFGNFESNLKLFCPVTYDIDTEYQAQCNFTAAITHLVNDTASINNNLLVIEPGVNVTKKIWFGKVFCGVGVGRHNKLSLLPNICANYKMEGTEIMVSGGWQAQIVANSFMQLTTENPFIFTEYRSEQTRKDELFANIAGSYNPIVFAARFSWINYVSLPTFLDTGGDNKQFHILYDSVSALSVQLSARYLFSNFISAGVTANFCGFYQGTQQYPWHIPANNLKGDFSIKPLPELAVFAYMSLLGGIHVLNNTGSVSTLKPQLDCGGSGEYYFNKWHSTVFLQISNIFNQNFERWLGYPGYGMNIYGGVRLKF